MLAQSRAFSTNTASIPVWSLVLTGGFITTTQTRHIESLKIEFAYILIHKVDVSSVKPRLVALPLAISRAEKSTSTAQTNSAPSNRQPIPSIPFPQPRSSTTSSLMLLQCSDISQSRWAAMWGGVGYCLTHSVFMQYHLQLLRFQRLTGHSFLSYSFALCLPLSREVLLLKGSAAAVSYHLGGAPRVLHLSTAHRPGLALSYVWMRTRGPIRASRRRRFPDFCDFQI